jgi:hypothetical protein
MTDTDTTPSPAPLFSADEGIDELWVKAYQGEVLGEAFFLGVADRLDDAERANKMRVLATLERRTKEAVAPALERAGISTEPDAEMLTVAEALAPDSASSSWEVFMSSVVHVTDQYLPLYRRIGELDPIERETANLLVGHEIALGDFALAELAGDTATSLYPVNALAHMR